MFYQFATLNKQWVWFSWLWYWWPKSSACSSIPLSSQKGCFWALSRSNEQINFNPILVGSSKINPSFILALSQVKGPSFWVPMQCCHGPGSVQCLGALLRGRWSRWSRRPRWTWNLQLLEVPKGTFLVISCRAMETIGMNIDQYGKRFSNIDNIYGSIFGSL